MKKIQLSLVIVLSLCSCGTGPWVTKKINFDLYKSSIFENHNVNVMTNGIYVETGELNKNIQVRKYYIFYKNGYCLSGTIPDKEWQKSFISSIKNIKPHLKTEYDIYKIKDDSILIDKFGSNPNTYYRWVTNYKGKIIGDSIIHLLKRETTFDYYSDETLSIFYKFFPTNEIPEYAPTSWYLEKKWYQKNLHKSRK